MDSWIEIVNADNEIHKHLNECFLNEHISLENEHYLNWMNIFNSKIVLSNEFIIKYLDNIDWRFLTRVLDEAMLVRYSYYVMNWNAQLYGQARTFEFMLRFEKKFNWRLIDKHPPTWFNETHFFVFRDYIYPPLTVKSLPRSMAATTIAIPINSLSSTPKEWAQILGD